MLKGLHPDCPPRQRLTGYGFVDYGDSSQSREIDDRELCRHALERGVESVFILDSLEQSTANRSLACRELLQ